jgi:hypothetical protein
VPGSIGVERQRGGDRHGTRRDVGAGRSREPEFPLAKNNWGECEEKSEEGVEHEFLGFYFYL